MSKAWLLGLGLMWFLAPAVWADEGPPAPAPPPLHPEAGEGLPPHPEMAEGPPPPEHHVREGPPPPGPRDVPGEVLQGILLEVGKKGAALRVGERIIELILPPRLPERVRVFLRQHLRKPVGLRCVKREGRWVLIGPARRGDREGPPPLHPREGDRPHGPRPERDRPPRMPGKVVRGVLQKVRERDIVLRVGEGEGKLIEVALPPHVPPPMRARLKQQEGKPVNLPVRAGDAGPVLLAPAPPVRPPERGERRHPERREGRERPPSPEWLRRMPEHMRAHLREHLDKLERMERMARELAEKIRRTQESEAREQLVNLLRELLGKLFELREAPKRKELERLTREVERLRDILRRRAENKDKIVERRLRELVGPLGEEDVLRW
jgi:hypothetical protein